MPYQDPETKEGMTLPADMSDEDYQALLWHAASNYGVSLS